MEEPPIIIGIPLGPNEFHCAACGGIFNKGWTDEEATAEFEQRQTGVPLEETALVCDDCYKEMGLA